MLPPDLITEARIISRCEVTSKKRLLESLGELLAGPQLSPDAVFQCLRERERLGSTGIGHGIALPHARVDEIEEPIGAFIQLRTGVDFDAIDNRPVDLAFALLVPGQADERHLQLLATLAEMFNDARLRERLRAADGNRRLLDLLTAAQPGASV
jgi:PTS system nitrogen regulatory IIA component